MKKVLCILTLATAFSAVSVSAETWVIDPAHTHIGFSVKHMLISNVKGKFVNFSGGFEFDEKSKKLLSLSATIDASSIDTGNEKRDNHLRSPDFLDVAKYGNITFKSQKAESHGDGRMAVTGDLTIHGVTREVVLDVEYLGAVNDPWGNRRAGFTASATINRFDYGLEYDSALEAGGLVVGKEVKMVFEVEGILKK